MVRRDENKVSRDDSCCLGRGVVVAIWVIVGETTPMRGAGEGHFLTQDKWGVGSVDSWVTHGRNTQNGGGVHQGEGGLLEGSKETCVEGNNGGPKLWIIWSEHRDKL